MGGCSGVDEPLLSGPTTASASAGVIRVAANDLPGWASDNHAAALETFRRSCAKNDNAIWRAPCEAAGRTPLESAAAKTFFEANFDVYRINPGGSERGFLTGYFEPEVNGSRGPGGQYNVPIYRKPPDMRSGRAYLTRREIEAGALAGKGLELVWLDDPVDAFFMHVQGSARVRLNDGSVLRLGFAAKNERPYTSIGKVLIDLGEIPRDQVSMQSIRAWFDRNPGRIAEITQKNDSFIFFRELEIADPNLGPIGAQGVSLTTMRSLAVDRKFHKLSTPIWIAGELPNASGANEPVSRLMIAQDTGSAILGAARGDVFFGAGDQAGARAGLTQHRADFYMFLPKGSRLPQWAQ